MTVVEGQGRLSFLFLSSICSFLHCDFHVLFGIICGNPSVVVVVTKYFPLISYAMAICLNEIQ